jgi:hypothetical protein
MVNLIWKRLSKDANCKKEHLIFMNFGVKNFTMKSNQYLFSLMFERYNLMDAIMMEQGAVTF